METILDRALVGMERATEICSAPGKLTGGERVTGAGGGSGGAPPSNTTMGFFFTPSRGVPKWFIGATSIPFLKAKGLNTLSKSVDSATSLCLAGGIDGPALDLARKFAMRF